MSPAKKQGCQPQILAGKFGDSASPKTRWFWFPGTATINYTTLHDNYNYTTLHYNTLDYTTLYHATTLQYTTLQYTTPIAPHHKYNCNCNDTTLITLVTLITLQYSYNLQLQPHYATTTTTTTTTTALHHTTSSSCGEVTSATIATAPGNTTPTTFRSISGFALPSVSHNNQPFL